MLKDQRLVKKIILELNLTTKEKIEKAHEYITEYFLSIFEQEDSETQFEDIETYLRLNIFFHVSKS